MSNAKQPNAGTCGICGKLWMLDRQGRLVNHGFQRPGWGYQTSGCFGEKTEPYEKSTKALNDYIALINQQLEEHNRQLAKFEAEPTLINDVFAYTKPLTLPEQIGPEHPNYKPSLKRQITDTKRIIGQMERERTRCQKRVTEWTKQPLKYKEKTDKTPSIDRITIDEKYRWLKRIVVAKEKGFKAGIHSDSVKIEFEDGKTFTVRARSLKPVE